MAFDQRLAECTTLSNSYVQGEIPLDPATHSDEAGISSH